MMGTGYDILLSCLQVRESGFYPRTLEKDSLTNQELGIMMAKIYVQGVFTRKVIEVLQRLVGPEVSISSTHVSPATERLDVQLIVDNYATHKHTRVQSWLAGRPRYHQHDSIFAKLERLS